MRAELAGRVDQISALHSERHQMQLEVSRHCCCSRVIPYSLFSFYFLRVENYQSHIHQSWDSFLVESQQLLLLLLLLLPFLELKDLQL